MRRRYSQPEATAAIDPHTLDVMIHGWGAPVPPEGYPEWSDPFGVFELDDEAWRALWQKHKKLILEEARRRGVVQTFAEQEYGGETK